MKAEKMNEIKQTEPEAIPMAETEKPAAKTRQTGIKRMLATRVTSISISDIDIRLTVVRGSEIEKWVACPLETGVVVNGIVQDSDNLSATLKGLFRIHKINTKKLIVGLPGLHAITRIITLPKVSKKVLREAIIYEAERELPVPIDSIYLFWQIIEQNSQEMKIFLIAYAQNTIDALMNTMRKAGVKPYILELAPLALARCVNSPTSIVFDVRPGELDIVVNINDIPELIRSVPLPPYTLVEDNLPIILPIVLDELQRTITFCKSAKSIDDMPIFGFGDLGSDIFESLSTALNHRITLTCPLLDYPPEFSPETCSVSLGLALGKMKLPEYASQRVNINLLPESYKIKLVTPKMLATAGMTAALAILVAVFIMFQVASSQTEAVRTDLETQTVALNGPDGWKAAKSSSDIEVANLTAARDTSATQLQTFNASLGKLKADQVSINEDLEKLEDVITFIDSTVPSSISLSLSSTPDGTGLTIGGVAPTQELVLDYVGYLEKTELFSNIVLKINEVEDGTNFSLSLTKAN